MQQAPAPAPASPASDYVGMAQLYNTAAAYQRNCQGSQKRCSRGDGMTVPGGQDDLCMLLRSQAGAGLLAGASMCLPAQLSLHTSITPHPTRQQFQRHSLTRGTARSQQRDESNLAATCRLIQIQTRRHFALSLCQCFHRKQSDAQTDQVDDSAWKQRERRATERLQPNCACCRG